MDVLKCKAFISAVDEGSLTGAGKVLGYTPSGISQLISAMEAEFGFALLIRKNNGVVPTREGESLYPLIQEYIDKETAIYEAATEMSGMYKGNVMIATYASIAAHTLPAIIKDFTDMHPSINIQIEETTASRRWYRPARPTCRSRHGFQTIRIPGYLLQKTAWWRYCRKTIRMRAAIPIR